MQDCANFKVLLSHDMVAVCPLSTMTGCLACISAGPETQDLDALSGYCPKMTKVLAAVGMHH